MVALAGCSARRRNVPDATSLMIASLFTAAWAFGSLLETAAVDPGTKIFWFKYQAIVQLPMVVATTCFVLEYAWTIADTKNSSQFISVWVAASVVGHELPPQAALLLHKNRYIELSPTLAQTRLD